MLYTKKYKLYFLALFALVNFISCSDDDSNTDEQTLDEQIEDEQIEPEYAIKTYSFDGENSDLILQEGEAQEVMIADNRRYAIASVLRLKPVDEFTFEVTNFSPVAIENATVLASIDGIDTQVKFFEIERIAAFATNIVRYSFLDDSTEFRAVDDALVDLSAYKSSGIAIDKISFDFTGESEYILRLKKLTALKWEMQYHDYDPEDSEDNNWEENLTALDVRRYTGMIINFGFMVVSDEFREGLIAEKMFGNDGETLLTKSQKEEIYQQILNKEFLQMGKVVNVAGLGGGNVLGVAEHVLNSYLRNNQFSTVSHEFGHIVGYNHDSGMTYPNEIEGVKTGIDPLTQRVHLQFLETKAYPVTLDNYSYKADFEE